MQTDATVSIEPIPIDSERFTFDRDAGQDDESHLCDGVHGFSGGLRHLTIQRSLGQLFGRHGLVRLALVFGRA